MFLVVKKPRTFSSLPCSSNEQVCRSWEGAQPGSLPKLDNGNIPYQDFVLSLSVRVGQGTGCFFFSVSSNLLLSGSLVFFGNFATSMSSGFCNRCWGTGCELVIGWQENCCCSSSSVSFVFLLNCLCLNLSVLSFVHFSSPSHWWQKGSSERVAV